MHRGQSKFKKTLIVESGSGKTQSVVEWTTSEQTSNAEVIHELGKLFNVAPGTLADTLKPDGN